MLVSLLPHVARFAPNQVATAAEHVGIYAWYPVLDAGEADWRIEFKSDVDLGIERMRSLLQRHSARFNTPPLEVHAVGRLTAQWRGSIPGSSGSSLEEFLSCPAEDEGASHRTAFHAVLNAPGQRKRLVEILRFAVPIFSAPVYVGISDNLRRRLRDHVRDLMNLYETVQKDPDVRIRAQQKDMNFATRAIGAGFTPDTLEVWTLDLESAFEDATDPEGLRDLAEAAEWLLNRWSRPLFGKR